MRRWFIIAFALGCAHGLEDDTVKAGPASNVIVVNRIELCMEAS